MALTLVVETGSGASNSNSYASVADGDSYHDAHLYGTAWTNATTAKKETALAMATRTLDDHVAWDGRRSNEGQALGWPRQNVHDYDNYRIDSDEIPQSLKDATAEMARLLLTSDRLVEPDSKGISEVKAGEVNVKFDKTDRDLGGVIPNTVKQMIRSLGEVLNRGSSQSKALRV